MYTACGLMLVSFIYIMFHNGEPIRSLLWSGPTVGIFPDFFEAVKDATRPNPYDERAIYPAFAYFLLYWVSKFIPYDCTNWPEISLTREVKVLVNLRQKPIRSPLLPWNLKEKCRC